ncbi:rhodanese-like domain-containing protein [Fulvivirga ligni]|uniref:rhodanese-like domain-containing protein n=1 Tax=Fulvivirga ligni TaxID=2904246 RepID=UPI001F3D564E|nr:rhodanese-like domain-containing protein [Fulvivirga ligni]UII19090.1 rhodanese-like domain-containing protein [Fulvivirga ligni]
MRYIFTITIMFFFTKTQAQEVESKAYKLMLNTLLSHSVPELSVADVKTTPNIIWLDAREKNEYQVSHIKNANWVGYDDFSIDRVKDISKDAKVIVYCSVGYRSEKISEKLIKAGFKDVQNLYGGIFEWKNQDKTVVNSDNAETEKIHAYSKMWGIWLKKGEKVYE